MTGNVSPAVNALKTLLLQERGPDARQKHFQLIFVLVALCTVTSLIFFSSKLISMATVFCVEGFKLRTFIYYHPRVLCFIFTKAPNNDDYGVV